MIKKKNYKMPHAEKREVAELPGLALCDGSYSGFGKGLCISVDEGAEPFEESENTEENNN